MSIVAPPRQPLPPGGDELEALIKEARRRQRRRRVLSAAIVAAAAVAGATAYAVTGHGGSSPVRTAPSHAVVLPLPSTRFVVAASTFRRPRLNGIVIADPARHSCRRVGLPDSGGYVVFSGERFAYSSRTSRAVWAGTIGSRPRRLATATWLQPYWVQGRLALVASLVPRLTFVGGSAITFAVPRGAELGQFASSRGRILFSGEWGSGPGGNLHSALFVYANGRTRRIWNDPNPHGAISGGPPAWSPDGSRIAVFEGADLWTIAPDGSRPARLTRSETVHKAGPLLWSPDGGSIAFSADRLGVSEVYVASVQGGGARRLTRSTRPAPPYDELGTVPLAWLGNRTLAVLSGNSLGVVSAGGGRVTPVCTVPNTTFSLATALR